jgi:hypothetical protein
MSDPYENELYRPLFTKHLSEAEAAFSLREAWKKVYGGYPKDASIALLWAQSALETGRWKAIRNYNFGNIKYSSGTPFTMFRCNELLWDNKKKKMVIEWFNPPHRQTWFRAYKTAIDGAEDYIRFVSQKKRYRKAWAQVIAGDPVAYSHELKIAGYYTASEKKYTKGVVSLTNEFLRRKAKLLSWEPVEKPEPETDSDPEVTSPDLPSNKPPSDPPPVLVVFDPIEEELDEDDIPTLPSPAPEESSEPPPQSKKGGMFVIIAIALAGIASFFTNLFSSCN